MSKTLKPEQPAPQSGIYNVVGPRGGKTNEQVVSTENHSPPPTKKPGQGYRLAKPAHHHPPYKK